MTVKLRVAIISHGHPELSQGGVEHLSYTLFQHLKSVKGVKPTYISRVGSAEIGHDGNVGTFRGRPDELIWSPPPVDWFRFASSDRNKLSRTSHEILSLVKPDIVHIQHFAGTGLDFIEIVKKDFNIPVVYTLQEYLPICFHNGQMVKKNTFSLCYQSSYSECSNCFPHYSSGKFFLRKKHILSMLNQVDKFISPSKFIKKRYAEWGLNNNIIEDIDYLLPDMNKDVLQTPILNSNYRVKIDTEDETSVKTFGYFGQINPFKGIKVLLGAAKLIPQEVRSRVRIVVFGTNQHQWGEGFVKEFENGVSESSDILSYYGPYNNKQVISLMQSVDWTIVPSTWWENSPVVIHEAKAAGRPILCSNIGGMKEKVQNGVDGLHFLADSSVDLANKITDIALGKISLDVQPDDIVKSNRERLAAHIKLYKSLC